MHRGSSSISRGIALLFGSVALNFAPQLDADPVPSKKPLNIVLIFCDDLGYGDLGVYGAKGYATPHLDRLASEGMKFHRFYVAQAVCSASRAALMTGCYPNRIGIKGALGPRSTVGIADGELTLGELAKSKGYQTAVIGKWHLGHLPPFLPEKHGFDEYFGLPYSNDMWPYHPDFENLPPERKRRVGFPELPLFEGTSVVNPNVTPDDQRQLTTWYAEHAVKFINEHHDKPFFLYLAHSMPHVPLYVSDKYQGKSERGLFGDVIEEIDWSVGEVLEALRRHSLEDHTLVMFASDNGPWLVYGNHAGSAGPLREGKGTAWEGGVREPFIARWPGVIPAGSECHEAAMTIDILPTIASLIGGQLPSHPIDGVDISPLLRGEPGAKSPHDRLYFYYADNELHAVSSGPWKLHLPHVYRSMVGGSAGKDGKPGRYLMRAMKKPELYNVVEDVGETMDVAENNPSVVEKLLAITEEARIELGDSLTKREGRGTRAVGKAMP